MNCEDRRECVRCGGCSGCHSCRNLTLLEIELLDHFAVIPFLPIAVDSRSGKTVIVDAGLNSEAACLALHFLQRKGLVQINADMPLSNTDYSKFDGFSCGSAALTALGAEILDDLEFGSQKI